jgi:hypothetical protein
MQPVGIEPTWSFDFLQIKIGRRHENKALSVPTPQVCAANAAQLSLFAKQI